MSIIQGTHFEQRHQTLQSLHDVVAIAKHVAKAIRSNFPIEDKPWSRGAIFSKLEEGQRYVNQVVNALVGFDKALFRPKKEDHLQSPWKKLYEALPAEGRRSYKVHRREYRCGGLASFHLLGNAVNSQPTCDAVMTLMGAHEKILEHYHLTERVTDFGSNKTCEWDWPNVPPISQELLEELDKSASDLEHQVAQEERYAEMAAEARRASGRKQAKKNQAPLANAKRDEWVARQRAKKEPPPWDEIYDEGSRQAAKRGWDMPGSPKALEEAHRRYLKRKRTATNK
jgi:hypothetical protein